MTQTATSFGMYEELRDYAELLDYLLVKIRSSGHLDVAGDGLKLARFLADVGNAETNDLTARYVRLMLGAKKKLLLAGLPPISQKISSSDPGIAPSEVRILEDFARFLDTEQAEAAGRIRGSR